MDSLGLGQKPVVMPAFPHMMREDTDVWTKFIASGFGDIKRVWYDVHVGKPVEVEGDSDSVLGRISRGLTRKRIDCVAAVAGGVWVIEVKPMASMYSIGQVLTYARLFRREYISPGRVIPVIVCDSYDEDLLDAFDELGVLVIVNG